MLILLFVIGLVLVFIGLIIGKKSRDEFEQPLPWVNIVLGVVIDLACIILLIEGAVTLSQGRIIDNKIVMYQEENERIETTVTTTVEKYLEHEYQIFDSLQGEDIQTLLVVYPEINSNELVKRQVEIFVENNNKIKELKEQKLNIEVWKFWVYFGG